MNNLVRFQLALRMTTATPPRYNHVAPVDSHSSRAFALIEHVLIHELHAWVYLLTAASSLENFYLWNPLRVCDSCKRPFTLFSYCQLDFNSNNKTLDIDQGDLTFTNPYCPFTLIVCMSLPIPCIILRQCNLRSG
mmetsp:Transcript_21430/g.27716  ORF Transcript_21430/g.27716 Transcript_21430/m.27716 type:complete len:135 (+) Transcript_21430:470-874(+)